MQTLYLRLAGPVQNYNGYRLLPNSAEIPSAPLPRKSAVAGLVGAALGSRDLAAITDQFAMVVRADRMNPVESDLQVVTPLPVRADARAEQVERTRVINKRKTKLTRTGGEQIKGKPPSALIQRGFIPHSEFILALTTPRADAWYKAFASPVFMPYLGRKSNAPTFPFLLGTSNSPVDEVLAAMPKSPGGGGASRVFEVRGDFGTHDHGSEKVITPPSRKSREEWLAWFSQHLTR